MNKKHLIAAVAFVNLIQPGVTLAENSGFTITPSVGIIDFENDRASDPKIGVELDDEVFGSLSLGYRFDSPWAVELVAKYAETQTQEASPVDIDYQAISVDGLYYIESDTNITPYLAFGGGYAEFESSATSKKVTDETNLNVGAGLNFAFTDWLAARTDLRLVRDFDERNLDLVFSLGLQFLLGGWGADGSSSAAGDSSAANANLVAEPAVVSNDTDADGVNDNNDNCPLTPIGIEVDANGCALDDDGDQVANHRDNCPDSEAGSLVDADGCYVMLEVDKEIELKVNFANNSDEVTPQYYDEIKRVADFMKKYPNSKVVIEGHTDSSGPASYNQQLSERRAEAVARTLSERFDVDGSRVASEGLGEAKPVANNQTAEGRAANRRVVAVVSATVEQRVESDADSE